MRKRHALFLVFAIAFCLAAGSRPGTAAVI